MRSLWKVVSLPDTTVLALLGLSLAGNGYMAVRLFRSPREAPAAPTLRIGETVPAVEAHSVLGERMTLSYADDSRPTVLYVFAPGCGWCQKNAESIRSLFAAHGKDYRFAGVSLDDSDLNSHVGTGALPFPVYGKIPASVRERYKLGPTPQTIVISPQGKVLANWPGAYVGNTQTQVEAFFGVKLPQIAPPRS